MSMTVCLCARSLQFPQAGGHQWVFLNWALELRALGCQVIWLEVVMPDTPAHEVREKVAALKSRLERYDLAEYLTLCSQTGDPLPRSTAEGCLDLGAAAEADLLLNLKYNTSPEVVGRFRRSALLDIRLLKRSSFGIEYKGHVMPQQAPVKE
jgi:hypothetical protein